MRFTKDRPICEQELFSDINEGCKMCGMPLEDKTEDFCSENCAIDYQIIHRTVIKQLTGYERRRK